MDEQTKKAFDFAADITKQLITVAAAIVTLSVTFSKDTPVSARCWAFWAWIVFLISIGLGFLTLMSLAAELQPKPGTGAVAAGNPAPSIWKKNVTIFSIAQMFAFLAAVALTARFGAVAMNTAAKTSAPPTQICNCMLPAGQPVAAPSPAGAKPAAPASSSSKKKPGHKK